MATEEAYVEIYDVAKEQVVAKAPLAEIKFMPRTGERIFIPKGPGDWHSYTIAAVEYFLPEDQASREGARIALKGLEKVTLYVEPSK
jgi:hypothetical protein